MNKVEIFIKEDIEKAFQEQNIQIPLEQFIDLVRVKSKERKKAEAVKKAAAKPKNRTVEIYNIHPALPSQEEKDVEAFLNTVVPKTNTDLFDHDDFPDEGADETDYYKIGDRIYEVEVHAEAEWYGEWSMRCNMPSDVSLVSFKEITDFKIKETGDGWLTISIPITTRQTK